MFKAYLAIVVGASWSNHRLEKETKVSQWSRKRQVEVKALEHCFLHVQQFIIPIGSISQVD
jgi:hypothetical protein